MNSIKVELSSIKFQRVYIPLLFCFQTFQDHRGEIVVRSMRLRTYVLTRKGHHELWWENPLLMCEEKKANHCLYVSLATSEDKLKCIKNNSTLSNLFWPFKAIKIIFNYFNRLITFTLFQYEIDPKCRLKAIVLPHSTKTKKKDWVNNR